MSCRRNRRVSLCACLLLCLAPSLRAGTLQELFRAATTANQGYSMFRIDLELAALRKGKGEIEAKVELSRLNAESTYLSALADYRKSILGFYNEVIDAVYAAATAELDASIAALRLENAREDRKYAESRYRNGLLSEVGFRESDITLKTATTDQELAAWTYQDARDAVRLALGMDWRTDLPPAVPAFEPDGTVEQWLAADTTLRKARLAEKIASLETAGLASNAPSFDRKIQETELLKAQAAVKAAESAGRRAHESALRNWKNQRAVLQIRAEESELKSAAYQDALKQYESGMISLNDRNLQQISVFTARKSLLTVERAFLKTMGAFLSAMDRDPLGL